MERILATIPKRSHILTWVLGLSVVLFMIFVDAILGSIVGMGLGITIIKSMELVNESYFPFMEEIMITSQYLVSLPVAITWLLVIERTSKENIFLRLGFVSKEYIKDYLHGLLQGMIIISVVCISILLLIRPEIIISFESGLVIILYFLFFVFQGFTEELILRALMLPLFIKKYGTTSAIVLTSFVFSLLHLLNPGGSQEFAVLNLFLVSIIFSYVFIISESLLFTSAVHTIWNFALGNIYGFKVSGIEFGPSILNFELPGSSSELITGGEFGPEASIVTTFVLVIIIIILVIKHKASTKNNNML